MLVSDAVISSIDSTLQQNHDRDDTMKTLFNDARNTAQDQIADLLSDFRHKRSIGRSHCCIAVFSVALWGNKIVTDLH